jgi:Cu+-exporting ATPase
MNLIHGTLVVTPNGEGASPDQDKQAVLDSATTNLAPESAAAVEAAQVEEQRAEIADLTRRVVLGAMLTAPVVFAVMAESLFGVDWVPATG